MLIGCSSFRLEWTGKLSTGAVLRGPWREDMFGGCVTVRPMPLLTEDHLDGKPLLDLLSRSLTLFLPEGLKIRA